MKTGRIATACALALGACGAFAQSGGTPVTADTSVQLYGHLDLSYDVLSKGIKQGQTSTFNPANTAVGRLGWQDDIASNLSYFGLRGSHDLGDGLRILMQFEAQIDVAATPGGSVSRDPPPCLVISTSSGSARSG